MNVRKNARLTRKVHSLLVRRRRGAHRPQPVPKMLQASAKNLVKFVPVPVRRQLQQESSQPLHGDRFND
jgi:hypothetical protein